MLDILAADPLGTVAAAAGILLFLVNLGMMVANLRTARATKLSAQVLANEFRVARLPRIRVTWNVGFVPYRTSLVLNGTIQETRDIPAVVRGVYTLFEAHGRPDGPWVPHLQPCGSTLYGRENHYPIFTRIENVTIPPDDQIIGAIRTRVIISPLHAENILDEWEISWAVARVGGGFETSNMRVDITDVSERPVGWLQRWQAAQERWKREMNKGCY